MTRDQIVELVLEPSCGREISGILDPLDLVPLMGQYLTWKRRSSSGKRARTGLPSLNQPIRKR